MNKLLTQRKKFNMARIAASDSSDFDEIRQGAAPVAAPVSLHTKYHICVSVKDDGSLFIQSSMAPPCTSDQGEDSDIAELPKAKRQRSLRSNKRTPAKRPDQLNVSTSSDDEAFMNDPANFTTSPRPLRRSLRKRKTSSLRRRAASSVQTVPEICVPPSPPPPVTSLDDTVEGCNDLSLEWIENEESTTEPGSCEDYKPAVMSERSFLIANAETEDALSDYSDYNPMAVFKMPYPVGHKPVLTKRKLVESSDEEFIAKTFRKPIKRNCVRYFY